MHGNCVAYGTLVQLLLENANPKEFNEVRDFMYSVGLPLTLEEIGVEDSDALKINEASCAKGESIHNLSGDVTVEELKDAILLCDRLGHEFLDSKK